MADEGVPKQSGSGTSGEGESHFLTDLELDEVLSAASALAEELSDEVGAEASEMSGDQQIEEGGLPGDIEAELAELENLVEQTRTDVDDSQDTQEDGEPDTNEEAPDEPPGEVQAKDLDVPGFMSEFTDDLPPEPQKPAPAPTQPTPSPASAEAAPAPAPAQPQPDPKPEAALQPKKPGVVGTALAEPPQPKDEFAAVPAEETQESPVTSSKLVARILPALHAHVDRISPALLLCAERCVDVLEKVDRPISRLAKPVRIFAGYAAVATLGVSLIVLVLAMF